MNKLSCVLKIRPACALALIAIFLCGACSKQKIVDFPTVEGWNGYEWGSSEEEIREEHSGIRSGLGGSAFMYMYTIPAGKNVALGGMSMNSHFLFISSDLEGVALEAGHFQSEAKIKKALVEQFGEPSADGMWKVENFNIGIATISERRLVLIVTNNAESEMRQIHRRLKRHKQFYER